MLESIWQDIRYGLRALAARPGFTAVCVLTLALGIGASTAVFSVANAVLFAPLPFQDPERIVMLWERNPELDYEFEQVGYPNLLEWQQENQVFEEMGYVVNWTTLTRNFVLERDDSPIRLRARYASSGLFRVLGVNPVLGRTFDAEADQIGGQRTAILSHRLWTLAFDADPGVLGQAIKVGQGDSQIFGGGRGDGDTYTVVGVMPLGFAFPQDAQLWLSVSGFASQRWTNNRRGHPLWCVAKLKPEVTAAQAETELSLIQGRIHAAHPDVENLASHVQVVPLHAQVIGGNTRPAMLMLLGAVGCVLLIACANVANLLLARGTARHKEIAVRVALGAGRLRVVRQLLTESLLLAVLSGALGTVLAVWAVELFESIRPDATYRGVKEFRFDRASGIAIDAPVLAFTVITSLITGTLFGLAPALQAARTDINEVLKEEGRGASAGRGTQRLRSLLLVGEVAMALVLLVGAGLTIQSFYRLTSIDPGLQAEHVVRTELDLALAGRVYSGDRFQVYEQVVERLQAVPGVISVCSVGEDPLIKSGWQDTIAVEGKAIAASDLPQIDVRIYTPGVFRTLGVPLIRGRDFTASDNRSAGQVAIINENAARQLFGSQNPVGQRFQFRGSGPKLQIVAVAGDVRNFSVDGQSRTEVYIPHTQSFLGGAELGPLLLIRTQGDIAQIERSLRHAVERDRKVGRLLGEFQTIDAILSKSVSHERFVMLLLAGFGGVALVLATVGVYGVIAYSVEQRIREIGIRMALGAQPGQIFRLILARGLALCAAGIAIGLGLALVATRLLSSLVYGVAASSPAVYLIVALLLLAVGAMACYLPARRATRVDPAVALRVQ